MNNLFRTIGLSLVALFSLPSCRISTPTIEEEQTLLGDAGYALTLITGDDIDTSDKNTPMFGLIGVQEVLHANKESDEIYLMWFSSIAMASDYILATKLKTGQINEMLYAGTAQAIKDAKL